MSRLTRSAGPAAGQAATAGAARLAPAGLALTGLSVALTWTVAVLGTSVAEPALPGRPGQPPWSFAAHPSPYLVVGLLAVSLATGTAGLVLTMRAVRSGWSMPPWMLLAAGIGVAIALALVPPFGSSDQLNYAALGRIAVLGHDPYTMTPAQLARLGDPVGRAVRQFTTTPSVYGALATAGQALASRIGGTSVRLTVFILSLLNVAAFAATGLLLHWLARADRRRQLRAAMLWTANPVLLQVLVAGQHIDSQAVVFAVAAIAVFALSRLAAQPVAGGVAAALGGAARAVPADAAAAGRAGSAAVSGWTGRLGTAGPAAAAGVLIGLGFAVKVTMSLAGAGIGAACLLTWLARRDRSDQPAAGPAGAGRRDRSDHQGAVSAGAGRRDRSDHQGAVSAGADQPAAGPPGPARWRAEPLIAACWLAAGFAVTAAGSLAFWGISSLSPGLREGSYVSNGSPWRSVRVLLALGLGSTAAEDVVKLAAIAFGVFLLVRLVRSVGDWPDGWPAIGRRARPGTGPATRPGWPAGHVPVLNLVVWLSFAIVFAWLFCWPYVLPWYDAMGWALIALLPASTLDWLLVARTAALGFGYLTGAVGTPPAGLGWLEPVVRTGLVQIVLLICTIVLILVTRPARGRTAMRS